jgi:uncharacterized protein (TIGR02145 family)
MGITNQFKFYNMKKLYFFTFLLAIFIVGCEKDSTSLEEQNLTTTIDTLTKGPKVDVCHNGRIKNVSVNALSGHQGHGDAVDMDGDGYFDIANDCSATDCDDANAEVNPGMEEVCDNGIDDNCDGQIDENCVPNVTNPITGRTWMDRNLGASQVATSSTDAASYGNLYQWGRSADGHQIRTSTTTNVLSITDTPGHGDFIVAPFSPGDWRNPKNDNLWQGVSGVNNPCPEGYRLPTEVEWNDERASWTTNDDIGAFASPLKLPAAGNRLHSNGSLNTVGTFGSYWSSSTSTSAISSFLYFYSEGADVVISVRAYGYCVRCIKD